MRDIPQFECNKLHMNKHTVEEALERIFHYLIPNYTVLRRGHLNIILSPGDGNSKELIFKCSNKTLKQDFMLKVSLIGGMKWPSKVRKLHTIAL